jgi:Pyridoxamine 5'-phosphate oxidase
MLPQSLDLLSRRLELSANFLLSWYPMLIKVNSHNIPGYPFTSFQFFFDDCQKPTGEPFVALLPMGSHASNIKANANVSVHIRDQRFFTANDRTNLDNPRFTIFGQLVIQPAADQSKNLACLKRNHANADDWLLSDHVFYRLKISNETSLIYIGGFGSDHYVGWWC